jgi:hypothetical protein
MEPMVIIAAIVTSCLDQPMGGKPSGYIYAELMGQGVELPEYNRVLDFAIDQKLIIRETSHLLVLTSKGEELARRIKTALGEGQ